MIDLNLFTLFESKLGGSYWMMLVGHGYVFLFRQELGKELVSGANAECPLDHDVHFLFGD